MSIPEVLYDHLTEDTATSVQRIIGKHNWREEVIDKTQKSISVWKSLATGDKTLGKENSGAASVDVVDKQYFELRKTMATPSSDLNTVLPVETLEDLQSELHSITKSCITQPTWTRNEALRMMNASVQDMDRICEPKISHQLRLNDVHFWASRLSTFAPKLHGQSAKLITTTDTGLERYRLLNKQGSKVLIDGLCSAIQHRLTPLVDEFTDNTAAQAQLRDIYDLVSHVRCTTDKIYTAYDTRRRSHEASTDEDSMPTFHLAEDDYQSIKDYYGMATAKRPGDTSLGSQDRFGEPFSEGSDA